MVPSRPRAVIFDLDNTLTPRKLCVAGFAPIFAAEFDAQLSPIAIERLMPLLIEIDQGGYNPRRGDDLRERLSWQNAPQAAALEEYWQRNFPEAVVPGPRLHEVFDVLREAELLLAVLTNGGVYSQNRKIDLLGLRAFLDAVIVSEAVGCKKPDPMVFETCCRELGGLEPADCWFVGDHPVNDVLGAEACGMTGIWITYDADGHVWPSHAPAAKHRISSLAELLPLLGLPVLSELV